MELLALATNLPEPAFDLHYLHHALDVPDGLDELELVLEYDKIVDVVQIYAVLLEPDGTFRGHVQCPGGPGPRRLVIRAGVSGASPGCVPGPIPAGRWTVRLDLDRHKRAAPYRLTVNGVGGTAGTIAPVVTVPEPEPIGGAGWYRGELHSHSSHSDGQRPVGDLVAAARDAGLDFLAVTDHFTGAHWNDLGGHDGIVLLHSMELTSHRGHANLHGLSRWVDTYVDRPSHPMTSVADDVHAQGGLVCVNHAFSGDMAWRRFDTPWDRIDLIEIAHLQQGANNDAQIGLWDRLLTAGHRVIGVAGTDCHDPHDPRQALGQVVTVVHADDGTEPGIVAGLRAGRVWVWRGADLDMHVNNTPMGSTLDLFGSAAPIAAVAGHTPTPAPAARAAGVGGVEDGGGPAVGVVGDGAPEDAAVGHAGAPGVLVTVEVEVRADEPVVVFVLRDGLVINVVPVDDRPGEWQRVTVEDRIDRPGYYRAEVHADPGRNDPRFWASSLRDHSSLRAAGNPVWVR